MLLPDSRTVAFELIRPPSGYHLDLAVLTTYTLDLEALLVLPLSVLAHPDGGLEELLADPLRLHQAIRDAGDRVHAFVDETGIGIPRGARPLYSMLESSVHAVRAPNGGSFHPKVWVARFTADAGDAEDAEDEAPPDLLRVAILSRNLAFDRSWDVALASEASPRNIKRRVGASRPLGDFLSALPQLSHNPVGQGHRRACPGAGRPGCAGRVPRAPTASIRRLGSTRSDCHEAAEPGSRRPTDTARSPSHRSSIARGWTRSAR